MPVEDKPRAARVLFSFVGGATCLLYLLAKACGPYPSYAELVRVARVEGDPQRYTLREMERFPPAAEVVRPKTAWRAHTVVIDVHPHGESNPRF